MTSSRLLATALFVALVPLACDQQAADEAVALVDIPAPTQEIAEPFSNVVGATEFRPGELLVVDGSDAEVALVNFETGSRQMLGQRGGGPGEYTVPAGVLRLPGDTIVVLDVAGGGGGTSARTVRFNPDLTAASTGNMMLFNMLDTSVVQGTMFPGADGSVFSTAIKLKMGASGPVPSDTMNIVRFDLSAAPTFTTLGAIRTPQTGEREQDISPTGVKIKAPFPGLVLADAWTAFPDGRIAIIRGGGYMVEFVSPDGTVSTPIAIPYDRIPVPAADQDAELQAARDQLNEVMMLIRRSMPPNFAIEIEIVPPPEWPTEYPPVVAIVAHPAPDGNVWVRRSTPARLNREHWDVIDPQGVLVARWRLPEASRLVAVGDGVVYTTRVDADDLRYVQRVELPR